MHLTVVIPARVAAARRSAAVRRDGGCTIVVMPRTVRWKSAAHAAVAPAGQVRSGNGRRAASPPHQGGRRCALPPDVACIATGRPRAAMTGNQ